ncbi:unnamed protein product, partial [Mesorhabditis belari]|uniref:M02D8-5-like third CUB domain-containing protein n=1 Tax=Mesorhabditis belari TaxID=2138241 RepID=A0AAF3ENE5_9BILA
MPSFSIFFFIAFGVWQVVADNCIDELCDLKGAIPFSSPGYPGPYNASDASLKLLQVSMDIDSNYVMGVRFFRLDLAPNDCIHLCEYDDFQTCSKTGKFDFLCSSMDDGRFTYYYTRSNELYMFLARYQNSKPSDNGTFPGVFGEVVRLDAKSLLWNDACEESASLNDSSYALISDHFNVDTFTYTNASFDVNCQTKFSTKHSMIRVVVYTFRSFLNEPIELTGIEANSTSPITISINGSAVRRHGLPRTYYFKKDLTLTYKFTARSYYYYIVLTGYDDAAIYDSCLNNGVIDMSKQSSIPFSAIPLSMQAYNPNSNCHWNFTNLPPNHQWQLYVEAFKTETCCDVLGIDSPLDPTFQRQQLSGDYTYYLYSGAKDFQMSFQSDGIESYNRMSGVVGIINSLLATINVNLCKDTFFDAHSMMLSDKFTAVVYRFSNADCSSNKILGYFFARIAKEPLVTVYEGELDTGTYVPINNQEYQWDTLAFKSNVVTVRIVRTDAAYSPVNMLFTTDSNLWVYQGYYRCFMGANINIDYGNHPAGTTIVAYRGAVEPQDYPKLFGSALLALTLLNDTLPHIELFQGASLKAEDRIYGGPSTCDNNQTANVAFPQRVFGTYMTIKVGSGVPRDAVLRYYCNSAYQLYFDVANDLPAVVNVPKYDNGGVKTISWGFSNRRSIPSDQRLQISLLNKLPAKSQLTINYTRSGGSDVYSSPICHIFYDPNYWASNNDMILTYQWSCESLIDDNESCGSPLALE